jgi:hypothetical protein
MVQKSFPEPIVDPRDYRSSVLLIKAALAVPLPFLALDLLQGSADWFAPSGAIALFCVAFVQFRQLSRLQVKHFRNAEAAANGDTIQGLSTVYQAVDRQAFWAGLYGTAVWAYGDKLIKWLAV